MSGQPTNTQADINKFRNEYMETLDLQEKINDMNLQANKTYLLTGQLPPQSQMQDTRTNAEKQKDIEGMKQNIAKELASVAEPAFAYAIVNKVINSPLNVDNSLFRFLAQRAASIAEQLTKILPMGIRGDPNDLEQIVEFIRNKYAEQQSSFVSTKSFFNSQSSLSSSKTIGANDIDSVIEAVKDLQKNFTMIRNNLTPAIAPVLAGKIGTLENICVRLKQVLPTNNQVRLLMEDIDNPEYNNPYPQNIGAVRPPPEFNSADMTSFFKMLEKLPKYNIFMALVGKCNSFIKLLDYRNIEKSLDGLIAEMGVMLDADNQGIMDRWFQLKNRQEVKETNAAKFNETQSRQFIRNQREEQKDATKATKVYVVNPADDPVLGRLVPDGGAPGAAALGVPAAPAAVPPGAPAAVPPQGIPFGGIAPPLGAPGAVPPPRGAMQYMAGVHGYNPNIGIHNPYQQGYAGNAFYPGQGAFFPGDEDAEIDDLPYNQNYRYGNLAGYYNNYVPNYLRNLITMRGEYPVSSNVEELDDLEELRESEPIHSLSQSSLTPFRNTYPSRKQSIYGLPSQEIMKSFVSDEDIEPITRYNIRNPYKGTMPTSAYSNVNLDYKPNVNYFIDNLQNQGFTPYEIAPMLQNMYDNRKINETALKMGLSMLKKMTKGRGIHGGSLSMETPSRGSFIGFGISSEINKKSLDKGIISIRRAGSKANYMDLPSKKVSPKMLNIVKAIIGGGVPKFEDLNDLDDDEREYLSKLSSKANLEDRLSVPAPSKDQYEKDIHQFEVMKGQIMSGNDSKELVKKFKILVRKLGKQNLLPKNEVEELLDLLQDLGY
jgi:hypothetical protein